MELRHLRYFKAVAEQLNFSRAAETLRVAQPALSRQIRALEDELGTPLFEREHGVKLTDAGHVFYTHTCKILAQVDVATASAREATGGAAGELILCNDWRLGGQFVPAVVAEFHRQFPRVEVRLRDMRFPDQLQVLRDRRAHLGFVARTLLSRMRDLETFVAVRANIVAILPARHPFAAADNIRLADLADDAWVAMDEKEAPGYRAFLHHLCRLSGFTPRIEQTATTFEGIVGRVATGYGVALSLEANAPRHNPLVRAVPLDVEPLELCAVWNRHEKSPLLHAFLDVVRQQAAMCGEQPNTAVNGAARRATGSRQTRRKTSSREGSRP